MKGSCASRPAAEPRVFLLIGSLSAEAGASRMRERLCPDTDVDWQLIEGRAIASRAPANWDSLFALVSPDPKTPQASLAIEDDPMGAERGPFLARAMGDVVPGDGTPATQVVATLVFSDPVPGREAEFNSWYSDRHLPDVLQVPGYLAARRFSLEPTQGVSPPWRYLTIYEIDKARYLAATAELAARSGTERMPISEAAQKPVAAHFLLPAGKRLLCN